MKLLLLDPHKTTQQVIRDLYPNDTVLVAYRAADALQLSNDSVPDIVVMELSLAEHSGLEFLYEFRTYTDWLSIPVLIYSTVKLDDTVLHSRAWKELDIQDYLYKPDVSVATLKSSIEKYAP